jgi:hypothetical protein
MSTGAPLLTMVQPVEQNVTSSNGEQASPIDLGHETGSEAVDFNQQHDAPLLVPYFVDFEDLLTNLGDDSGYGGQQLVTSSTCNTDGTVQFPAEPQPPDFLGMEEEDATGSSLEAGTRQHATTSVFLDIDSSHLVSRSTANSSLQAWTPGSMLPYVAWMGKDVQHLQDSTCMEPTDLTDEQAAQTDIVEIALALQSGISEDCSEHGDPNLLSDAIDSATDGDSADILNTVCTERHNMSKADTEDFFHVLEYAGNTSSAMDEVF